MILSLPGSPHSSFCADFPGGFIKKNKNFFFMPGFSPLYGLICYLNRYN